MAENIKALETPCYTAKAPISITLNEYTVLVGRMNENMDTEKVLVTVYTGTGKDTDKQAIKTAIKTAHGQAGTVVKTRLLLATMTFETFMKSATITEDVPENRR